MHARAQLAVYLAFLALVSPAGAQVQMEWPEPVEPAELALTPVTTEVPTADGGVVTRYVGLARSTVGEADAATAGDRMVLPFARPVAHVDLARYADGTVMVLAGGIESDLQITRLDLETGSVVVMEGLTGRRRVAESFQGGLGTWPGRVDRGLFITVCEGVEQPELRAWADDGRSVIEPRPLPVSVSRIGIVWNVHQRRALVRAYVGDIDFAVVDILHPQMPELAFEGLAEAGVVAFGESQAEQRVTLVNRGRVDFDGSVLTDVAAIEVAVDDGAFDRQSHVGVLAGGRREIRVRWVGPAAASRVATLSVQGSLPGVGARLRLRWTSETLPAAAVPGVVTEPASSADPVTPVRPVDGGDSEAEAVETPTAPESRPESRVLGWDDSVAKPLVLEWSRPGRARIELWLVGSGPDEGTVRVRNVRTGTIVAASVPPGAGRPVTLEIEAAAFDAFEILPVDRGFPLRPELLVPRDPLRPAIHQVHVDLDEARADLVVTAAPHAVVLLAEGPGLPLVPISLREGRADASGRFRFDRRALGAGVGAVTALVVDPATGRVERSSPLDLSSLDRTIQTGSDDDRGN